MAGMRRRTPKVRLCTRSLCPTATSNQHHNLRGLCFDGASNMSGAIKGVQARLTELQPKAEFVHCLNQSLDLALVEKAKSVPTIGDVMSIVRDAVTTLKTAKRNNLFEEHVIQEGEEGSHTTGRRKNC